MWLMQKLQHYISGVIMHIYVKIFDNNTKDGMVNGVILLQSFMFYVMW